MTRRRWAAALVTVAAVTAGIAGTAGAATTATATTATCATAWGSQEKTGTRVAPGYSTVTDVRSGRHTCFDRLVVDLSGPAPAYLVRYVDRVSEDPTGDVVPLRGGAKLQITIYAPAYDSSGRLTYQPDNRSELVPLAGYRTFRQAAWAGTFEGVTDLGLGVRARLPFRVTQLAGPDDGSRLVIDVAHTW
jgi:hypothetical protein